MERKAFEAEVKAVGDEGVIEGYGSLFGLVDRGGDMVERGAFAASLARITPKMFFAHDPNAVLGVWDEVAEDAQGLRVKGRINLQKQLGREVMSDIKMGALSGLSIGYRTARAEKQGNVRVLREVELWEVSAVSMPMLPEAGIDAVKAAGMTEREFERVLTQDAGLTRSVARRLMAGGFKALGATQDAGADVEEIAAMIRRRTEAKRAS